MAKTYTLILGAVLLLIGIMGYVKGGAEMYGFGLTPTHNLIHVITGVLAIAAALTGMKFTRWFCLLFGAVYGLIAIAGFLNIPAVVTMFNLTMPDNILHLVVALSALYVGYTDKACCNA